MDYFYHPPVDKTPGGTPFLTEPGYALVAATAMVDPTLQNLDGFLRGFDAELAFNTYTSEDRAGLSDGERLCKVAGQLCYMSFGPGRTMNADAKKYFRNILESGHGSVIEHTNYTFLFYGISRSLTHELVRHRAGMAYSQVSQRYVDGALLRFVMRPEFQDDHELRWDFYDHIDGAAKSYEKLAQGLMKRSKDQGWTGSRTDLRKKVNQAARSRLPNDTEAPIMVTGNARAIRHFLNMRGAPAAEVEIRRLAAPVAKIMRHFAKNIFQDVETFSDEVTLEFKKV